MTGTETQTQRTSEMIASFQTALQTLTTQFPISEGFRFDLVTIGRSPISPNSILLTTGRDVIEDGLLFAKIILASGAEFSDFKYSWGHNGSVTLCIIP